VGGVVGDEDEAVFADAQRPRRSSTTPLPVPLVEVPGGLVGEDEARGFMRARASATRWRSPPESWAAGGGAPREPDAGPGARGRGRARRGRAAEDAPREEHVGEGVELRDEVE
jgi:hypothetical protein